MTDWGTVSGGECEADAMQVRVDDEVDPSSFLAVDYTPDRKSLTPQPQSPVGPTIKIETVKVEDVEQEGTPPEREYDAGVTGRHWEPPGDVNSDASNSELAFVRRQGRYVCSACNECFVSEDALYDHVYRECGTLLEMKCTLCSFQTEFVDDMRSHMALKHGDSPDLSFTQNGSLPTSNPGEVPYNSLNYLMHCDGFKHYKCPFCFYETYWEELMKQHFECVHSVGRLDRVSCPGCEKFYKNKFSLKTHMRLCEKLNQRTVKYKCFYCSHETKSKYYLKSHITWVHPVDAIDRPVCTGCGKTLKNDQSLKHHLRFCGKLKSDFVKYICFYCSHATKRKNNLEKHIRRIHPVGPIERPTCRGCRKSFENIDYLKKHMKYCAQLNTEVIMHKCKICHFQTKWIGGLKKHMETQHPIGETDRVNCTGCGKSFKNKESLGNHMKYCEKLTGGVTKLKCKFCDHETKRQGDMTRHLAQLHSVGAIDRPTCPGCRKSLKNDHSLERHIRICKKIIK